MLEQLKKEMQDVLEQNILRFWQTKMIDRENGGFYGRIDAQEVLHPEAEKGAILNARILWTFSAAYRVLGKQEYLETATYAKDYFIDHFIDKEYGGVYWSLDYKGQPLNTRKQFYAIGFALYGLSEYARATGDREALEYALDLYDCIEEHALDREHNGYIEAMTREWQPIADMRLSELDANFPKSQNTHLHLIEPYANPLRNRATMCRLSARYCPSVLLFLWRPSLPLRPRCVISSISSQTVFSIQRLTILISFLRWTGRVAQDIWRAMGTISSVRG